MKAVFNERFHDVHTSDPAAQGRIAAVVSAPGQDGVRGSRSAVRDTEPI